MMKKGRVSSKTQQKTTEEKGGGKTREANGRTSPHESSYHRTVQSDPTGSRGAKE